MFKYSNWRTTIRGRNVGSPTKWPNHKWLTRLNFKDDQIDLILKINDVLMNN